MKFLFNDGTKTNFGRVVHNNINYNLPGMTTSDLAMIGKKIIDDPVTVDLRFYDITDGALVDAVDHWRQTKTIKPKQATDIYSIRLTECWALAISKLENASVSVTTSEGTYKYGLDQVTRNNIETALIGVVSLLTPNPRQWTPKGASSSINLSYDDIKLIAGTVGNAFDSQIQKYLAHKAAMKALVQANDSAGLIAYDFTIGWPFG